MTFSFSKAALPLTATAAEQIAALCTRVGQSENFDDLAERLKNGLESHDFQGCFIVSCFGFNRESRFGRWPGRYVFPLRAESAATQTTWEKRGDLGVFGSGLFTLVIGGMDKRLQTDATAIASFVMLAEAVRLWIKGYTLQIDQEFDSLNHRKAGCRQLREVVEQLELSGQEMESAQKRIVSDVNGALCQRIQALALSPEQTQAVLDELDELARNCSLFARQQKDKNHQLRERVRTIAEFLLKRE
jgi:hypothetical protein